MTGLTLGSLGRSEEAIAQCKQALELDPLSLPANGVLGLTFLAARQYDQAIDQERKTLELDPDLLVAHLVLGLAYLQKAMYKEGIAEFEKLLLISPGYPHGLSQLGYAHAVAGNRAEAQKVLNQLSEISKQKYVSALHVAAIHVGLGEKGKAFEWLEKAIENRSIFTIRQYPAFDSLRSDQRFQDLLRRMNLQP